MSLSIYSFFATVLLGPLAALGGGIVVIVLGQDFAVGVNAAITGLVVGLVVAYLIANYWMHKWPTEYDPVDAETWKRAEREAREWDSKSHSLIEELFWSAFFWTLFFSGTITTLAVTLLVGWLMGG